MASIFATFRFFLSMLASMSSASSGSAARNNRFESCSTSCMAMLRFFSSRSPADHCFAARTSSKTWLTLRTKKSQLQCTRRRWSWVWLHRVHNFRTLINFTIPAIQSYVRLEKHRNGCRLFINLTRTTKLHVAHSAPHAATLLKSACRLEVLRCLVIAMLQSYVNHNTSVLRHQHKFSKKRHQWNLRMHHKWKDM